MIKLTNFKKLHKAFLFLIFSVIISSYSQAQFSYAGLRFSYHNVRFDEGNDMSGTRINDFVANVDLVHRPLRNFGIGLSARIPIHQGFKYLFAGDDYSQTIEGGGLGLERKVEFAGGDFEYNIQNTFSVSLFGRIYFDTEINYYLDIRYTSETYRETLSYVLNDNAMSNRNIQHEETIVARGFGFSVGYQPKIDDHFYFTYAFTVDFLGYDGVSFDYDIRSDNFGNDPDFVNIKSKIDDTQTAYEFSAGIGYVF